MASNKNDKDNDAKTKNKECFIIMPISDPPDYENGHFKKIYEDIFIPACIEAGLEPIRADDIMEAGMIHIEILQKLIHSSMAICDLSSHNPNVLFELGIRQAFDKPTVLVQEEGTKQIFDIAPLKYCIYRKNHIYREVVEDQKNLANFLKETSTSMAKGEIVNSIVKLLNIGKATIGENTSDVSVAYSYILSEINQLKNEFRRKVPSYSIASENDDYYGKILLSLKQLGEMVTNGTPINIFNKNYNDLKEQIVSIVDIDIRNMLLINLEEIKGEGDKFM